MSTIKSPQTRLQGRRLADRSSASSSPEVTTNFILLTIGLTLGALSFLTIGYFRYHKAIIQIPKLTALSDRLSYALQWQAFTLIPLFLGIQYVALTRLFTVAKNPLAGHEHLVEKPVKILTNTVEQTIFNLLNQMILVANISAESLFVIPFLVFCFVLGRILFMGGYTLHPKYRTPGFIITFVPTTILFFVNLTYAAGFNKYLSGSILKMEL